MKGKIVFSQSAISIQEWVDQLLDRCGKCLLQPSLYIYRRFQARAMSMAFSSSLATQSFYTWFSLSHRRHPLNLIFFSALHSVESPSLCPLLPLPHLHLLPFSSHVSTTLHPKMFPNQIIQQLLSKKKKKKKKKIQFSNSSSHELQPQRTLLKNPNSPSRRTVEPHGT